MALGKAVLVGIVASLAVPFVLGNDAGQLSEWAHQGLVKFSVADREFGWSLPIFAGVTLIAWLFLSWADK
jgi:hypothetical protein